MYFNSYYNYGIDFSRPLYYDIPDKDGIVRHYRIAMNADFIEIIPTKNSVDITKDDLELLVQNYHDIALWKKMFPPKSWIFKGFTIINLTDVTVDDEISNLKTTLLNKETGSEAELQKFQSIFRSIYRMNDLRAGFTTFDSLGEEFKRPGSENAKSFLLNNSRKGDCKLILCESAYKSLVKEHTYFTISNVEEYAEKTDNGTLATNLLDNGVQSCILAPVAKGGVLLGVLELVSKTKYELNSINAIKLEDILPYIVTSVERNNTDYQNRIKAIIQRECT